MSIRITRSIKQCILSMGGVERLWLSAWTKPVAVYENKDYDKIDSLTSIHEWYEFMVDGAKVKFDEEPSFSKNGLIFRQSLPIYFPKIEKEKRGSINELLRGEHLAIVKDLHGRYFLLGQQVPLTAVENQNTTGVKGEASAYSIRLESESTELIREINKTYITGEVEPDFVCPGVVLGNLTPLYVIANCVVIPIEED